MQGTGANSNRRDSADALQSSGQACLEAAPPWAAARLVLPGLPRKRRLQPLVPALARVLVPGLALRFLAWMGASGRGTPAAAAPQPKQGRMEQAAEAPPLLLLAGLLLRF